MKFIFIKLRHGNYLYFIAVVTMRPSNNDKAHYCAAH